MQLCICLENNLLLLLPPPPPPPPLALQPTVGFGLSNSVLPLFLIYHQLSPFSHSQCLKISFYFLFPSFSGSSPSRLFQVLRENNTDSGLRIRFYTMKKEVEGLDETMVPVYQITRCHDLKDRSLDSYCRDLTF